MLAQKRLTRAMAPFPYVLILIVALFVAAAASLVGFGLLARLPVFRSIDVVDAYWSVAGQRVERVKVGEPVTAHVLLRSQDGFDGDFIVRIRVDLAFRFDKDITTQRLYVVLRSGVDEEFELGFRPPLASAGHVNGYFIEVDFGFIRGSWTMPDHYPPRLIATPQ